MSIEAGTRVGPYDVVALVGEGGMGKVWRAHHTTLKRDDALKVLPDAFAADRDRLERFEREAQVLASLNHPNIAHVHGFEQAEGAHALVMEFVEGPTLAERVARGPLPVDDALAIARQIADALEAAHQQGIIHRDLKPGNIKVRPDGTVKVLDFGLAKVVDPPPDQRLSMSPTTPALSHAGVIVGTAAYMSPEQARGKAVDDRADIWAFGCVLYEMLSGRRAFDADDASLTLARVLEREADLGALPASVPARVGHAIRLCLRKDPRQRISDIRDVRLMLDGAFDAGEAAAGDARPGPRPRWPRAAVLLATAATGVVAGAIAVAWLLPGNHAVPPQVVRFALAASDSLAPRGAGTGRHVVALSPRGTDLVYWADERLYVRALDRIGEAVPIRGTEGAREPFFSPDGQWIGFHTPGQLKRVSVDGGAAMTLAAVARNPWGANWGADGTIRYGQGPDGIWAMPESGGAATQLIAVDDGELAHGPQLLPGGDWLLFTLRPAREDSWDRAGIVVQSLRTGERRVLVERGRDARYVATGHLVYGLDQVLLAVPFDVSAMRVTGGAVPLIEGVVDADVRTGAMQFSVSDSGALAYLAGPSGGNSTLAWITREGRLQPLPAASQAYGGPRVSPDGSRVVVDVERAGNFDVVVYDLARNVLTLLASSPAQERFPLWTPDGQRVVFYSDVDGGGLFWKAADGTGATERVTSSQARLHLPFTWSDGGRTLVFVQTVDFPLANLRQTDSADLFTVSVGRGAGVVPLLQTPAFEAQPTLSPGARWLAYSSAEAGGRELYVRPFPNVEGGRWQVSTSGGHSPLWSPDGKRLYFISGRQALAVPVETEPVFRPGAPTVMFDLPPVYSSAASAGWRMWDIAPDGDRFLLVVPGGVGQSQIVMVLNWSEELKRLVPAR